MAYKLIWSPAARDDLHDIVVFIARDNQNRAMCPLDMNWFQRQMDCKTFQNYAALFPSIGTLIFVRSFFAHIASSIESITSEGSVKLHASGILREDYHNYRQVRQRVGRQQKES